jgi:S1-C subfamily serine protease
MYLRPSVGRSNLFWRMLIMLGLLLPAAAMGQAPQADYVMSGTGFFVSASGQVVTNEHVVEGCSEVMLQGGVPLSKGRVTATDKTYDLALIEAEEKPRRFAILRHPDVSRIRVGEPVLVMGYPLDSFKTAQYQLAAAKVVGVKGPQDEPFWLQFSDSVQHGNSGGPLLDSNGNVAGVVVGKMQRTLIHPQTGERKLVNHSDIAISLPVLMRFLDRHYVPYRYSSSFDFVSTQVEANAKGYIVNILCFRNGTPSASAP